MWYQCHIELPPEVQDRLFGPSARNGTTFRRWIAHRKGAGSLDLPSAFFHYGEDGRPLVETEGVATAAGVRIGWYPRGMSISGVGASAVDVARRCAPLVHAELIRCSGRLLRASEKSGQNTVGIRPALVRLRYACPALIISPTNKPYRWLQWIDQGREAGVSGLMIPPAREWAEKLIAGHLQRQLQLHVEANERVWASDDDEWAAMKSMGGDWSGTSPFDVRIESAGEKIVINAVNLKSRDEDSTRKATRVGFRNVELTINADLRGVWGIGRMQSHGYGMLYPASRQWAAKAAA